MADLPTKKTLPLNVSVRKIPNLNYFLKSLKVAITTNQMSLNFPHKDASLRNSLYLSIPHVVLIVFGSDISTPFVFYGHSH